MEVGPEGKKGGEELEGGGGGGEIIIRICNVGGSLFLMKGKKENK